jgi:hypothetical protein
MLDPGWEFMIVPLLHKAAWELCFAWRPHVCELSRKIIWLQTAYRGTRVITGPGTPVVERYWLTPAEFVIWRLKNV